MGTQLNTLSCEKNSSNIRTAGSHQLHLIMGLTCTRKQGSQSQRHVKSFKRVQVDCLSKLVSYTAINGILHCHFIVILVIWFFDQESFAITQQNRQKIAKYLRSEFLAPILQWSTVFYYPDDHIFFLPFFGVNWTGVKQLHMWREGRSHK